jgi:hypothetical protein
MCSFNEVRGQGGDLIFAQLCLPADLLFRVRGYFLLVSGYLGRRRALLFNWGRFAGCFRPCIG